MVKSELIMRLAESQDSLSLRDVELSVNYILEKMSNSLANGQRIEVRGFGSFSLHYRPPRRAHNPKTGAHVQTHGKYTPHFKPGKDLRERVIASFELGKPIIESKDDDEQEGGNSTDGSSFTPDRGGEGGHHQGGNGSSSDGGGYNPGGYNNPGSGSGSDTGSGPFGGGHDPRGSGSGSNNAPSAKPAPQDDEQ